jgi:hypothetical protein
MRGIAYSLGIFMLLSLNTIHAQSLYVGGGVNGYYISNPYGESNSFMRRGYQFGSDLLFGGSLYFRTGLHILGSETEMEYRADNNTIQGSLEFTQMRLPVMIGLELLDVSLITIFAQTGLSGQGILSIRESEGLETLAKEVQRLQWSWVVGAGVRLSFVEVSLSYDLGLSSIFPQYIGTSSSRPGMLQMSIGFHF